jgi:hypothetical protein
VEAPAPSEARTGPAFSEPAARRSFVFELTEAETGLAFENEKAQREQQQRSEFNAYAGITLNRSWLAISSSACKLVALLHEKARTWQA